MKKNECQCRRMTGRAAPPQRRTAAQRAAASCAEPEMRRWPHPVSAGPCTDEAALHYISCALSYQNQLLADIKALLQGLSAKSETSKTEEL